MFRYIFVLTKRNKTNDMITKEKIEADEILIEVNKDSITHDVSVSSCCKGTGYIDLPNGEDCYCCCENCKYWEREKAENNLAPCAALSAKEYEDYPDVKITGVQPIG